MREREQFDLMVQDFAKAVVRTFTCDEDGIWTILAGGVPVHAVYNEEIRQVVTFVRLGEMLSSPFQTIWARGFLELNAFWDGSRGFTFALDHETGTLVIHDRRPFSYFRTAEHFAGYVNVLTGLAEDAVGLIGELEDAVEMAAEEAGEEEAGEAEGGRTK